MENYIENEEIEDGKIKRVELVNMLRKKGYTKRDAITVLDDVFQVLTEAILTDRPVMIHGFGTFSITHFESGRGWDIAKKEVVEHRPPSKPRFMAGSCLLRALRESEAAKGENGNVNGDVADA